MAKLLEHLPCEKKLREFAYSIWKRDSFGSHVGSLPLPTSHQESQLKQEMSKMDIRRDFFHCGDSQAVKNISKRGDEVSVLGGFQELT